jgi:flagellar hook protein FlgE
MFKPIYTSTGAMLGFSSVLDVISHNVSNMNTPGFKRSDVSFKDAFYTAGFASQGHTGQRPLWVGGGNSLGTTQRVFSAGELSATERELDAAIRGNGFFVLRKDGEVFYTRAGQFEIDDKGYLIDNASGARVMAYNGTGLDEISIAGVRTSPPKATSKISFEDNLSTGDSDGHSVTVQVYDALGEQHTLTVKFTKNGSVAGEWVVTVSDSKGQSLTSDDDKKIIKFRADGTPETDRNSFDLAMTLGDAEPMTVSFFFGEPGSSEATTGYSAGTVSTLRVKEADGHALGSLAGTTFDEKGTLKLTYSNGQTETGPQLAIADFFDRQRLEPVGDNLFRAPASLAPQLGYAGSGGMGELAAKNIELSNVDLTAEFSDIIINQRGFQASSQLMSVANELLDTLISDVSGRR